MSPTRFSRLVVAVTLVAYGVAVAVLLPAFPVFDSFGLGAWTALSMFWWMWWALDHKGRGKEHQEIVLGVGAFVGLGFIILEYVLWGIPSNPSSTAPLGYVTLPFLLLILTIAAVAIGGAIARDATPTPPSQPQ